MDPGSAPETQRNIYFFLDFFRGTLPPARRASDKPIAIACCRLVTFLPDRPLFNVPFFRSCIALFTFSDALAPYIAIEPPMRLSFIRHLGKTYAK
jgi:hypothetical protein